MSLGKLLEYKALPHDLIKNQLVDLIEHTFSREEVLYLACIAERVPFASKEHKNIVYGQKVTEALIYLLDNIYKRFVSKLYRQNVGIPMGTKCARPLWLLIWYYFAMGETS